MPPTWRISLSGTLRGIYFIRYFLFSGGAAIAGALVQRAMGGSQRPVLGLLIGLLVGFVVFRPQLRQALSPWLAMSQEGLYLVRKRGSIALPWSAIAEVTERAGAVTLRLAEGTPDEPARREVVLRAHSFGISSQSLCAILRELRSDPLRRASLPADSEVRQRIAPRAVLPGAK